MALRRRHPLGGEAGAQRFQLRHRLEHAGQPFDRGPRHHRAAMRAGIDQAAGRELAQRLAHRRARHVEAPRDIGLVERRARRQRAAHDLVGQLQPQFLGARDLVRIAATARSTRRTATRLGAGRCGALRRKIVEAHAFDRSLRFVDDADMGGDDPPALGEIAPRSASAARPCPAQRVAIKQGRGHRGVAAIGGDHGLARSCASARPASAPRETP